MTLSSEERISVRTQVCDRIGDCVGFTIDEDDTCRIYDTCAATLEVTPGAIYYIVPRGPAGSALCQAANAEPA